MDWHDLAREVEPHIFKIETPNGVGTGFLVRWSGGVLGVATAAHVVRDAIAWQQNIVLHHSDFNQPYVTSRFDSVRIIHPQLDSAYVGIELPQGFVVGDAFPEEPIEAVPPGQAVRPGVQVGWIGFPYLVNSPKPCFFSGYISACVGSRYFIDGVAIPGVSGGPAFFLDQDSDTPVIRILGSITAYKPSRTGSGVIPGLMVADDCTHWRELVKAIETEES